MARRSLAEIAQEEGPPPLHPKRTEFLLGHDAAQAQLLALIEQNRLPHALLIVGPRGIGKATLAYRLARFLLTRPASRSATGLFGAAPPPASLAVAADDPTFRRVLAGSHPDLLVLEAEEIKIEEARGVVQFLSLTPAESDWRVVIVDSADALNRNAANSLLKIVEEPPRQAVLLLVSHQPGTLVATLRSRCRPLKLAPLSDADFDRALGTMAPGIEAVEYPSWRLLSANSPGEALRLHEQEALTLYRELMEQAARPDTSRLYAFAERFSRKEQREKWSVLTRLIPWLLGRIAAPQNALIGELFPGERDELARLRARKPLDLWMELWEKAGRLLNDTDRLHLDRKQAILTILRAFGE